MSGGCDSPLVDKLDVSAPSACSKEAKVSVFENAFGGAPRTTSLESVIDGIRSERHREQVKKLRVLLNTGDKEGYDREKR